jgi:hypothetical protein
MYDGFWDEVERSKRLTPEQRFLAALELIDLNYSLRRAGVIHDHPDASEAEIREILSGQIETIRNLDAVR